MNGHNSGVMREHTLERNFTNVMSVAKPLQDIHILLNIKQSTLERNLTNVMSVAKLILNLQASPGISKYILKTNVSLTHVAMLLFKTQKFRDHPIS